MPLAGALIGGVAAIGGAVLSSRSNERAAETAAAAQREASATQTQYLREAQEKQLQFAREGQDYLKTARAEEQPGVEYLRKVVADPGHLTPAQQTALDEARRVARNQISTSSIAGSGRTAAALLKKVESDFTNDALEKNRLRSFEAASGMANRSGQYASGIGNISVGTGTQQAQLSKDIGTTQGSAAVNAGNAYAGAESANGRIYGETLGNLGSIVANEGRRSRYDDLRSSSSSSLG